MRRPRPPGTPVSLDPARERPRLEPGALFRLLRKAQAALGLRAPHPSFRQDSAGTTCRPTGLLRPDPERLPRWIGRRGQRFPPFDPSNRMNAKRRAKQRTRIRPVWAGAAPAPGAPNPAQAQASEGAEKRMVEVCPRQSVRRLLLVPGRDSALGLM